MVLYGFVLVVDGLGLLKEFMGFYKFLGFFGWLYRVLKRLGFCRFRVLEGLTGVGGLRGYCFCRMLQGIRASC